jgi:hypothetical protein
MRRSTGDDALAGFARDNPIVATKIGELLRFGSADRAIFSPTAPVFIRLARLFY